ncbi:unnamed protein product [Lota lota]
MLSHRPFGVTLGGGAQDPVKARFAQVLACGPPSLLVFSLLSAENPPTSEAPRELCSSINGQNTRGKKGGSGVSPRARPIPSEQPRVGSDWKRGPQVNGPVLHYTLRGGTGGSITSCFTSPIRAGDWGARPRIGVQGWDPVFAPLPSQRSLGSADTGGAVNRTDWMRSLSP